jgi:biopolymer transport protein ExbD
MKRRPMEQHRFESGPDMTPLVDVVMVILIFLMLLGTFAGSEWYLQQNLPYSKTATGGGEIPPGGIPDQEPLEIQVDENATRDGFVARMGAFQTSDADQLALVLAQRRTQLESIGRSVQEVPILISPAGGVKYQHLIRVYEAANRAQFTRIGFTTAR